MEISTINLKYGPMVISVEQTSQGWQRIARYSLVNHPKFSQKALTNKSEFYKTQRGAMQEADKYIAQQVK